MPLICCDFWTAEARANNLFTSLVRHFNINRERVILAHSVNGNSHLSLRKKFKGCLTVLYSGEPFFNPRHDQVIVSYQPSKKVGNREFIQIRDFEFYLLTKKFQLPISPIYQQVNDGWSYREKTRDVCFIVSNPKCWQRNHFFHLLRKRIHVVSAGKYCKNSRELDGVAFRSQRHLSFIGQFKFCICFENSSINNYLTEKIYYSYLAGTVPIYWGDLLVEKVFDPDTFIKVQTSRVKAEQITYIEKAVDRIVEIVNDKEALARFYQKRPLINPEGEEERVNQSLGRLKEIFES